LATTFIDLLRDPAGAAAMGARAKQVFSSQAGATGRSMDALAELLSAHDKTEQSS
jgi:hypothetical protein